MISFVLTWSHVRLFRLQKWYSQRGWLVSSTDNIFRKFLFYLPLQIRWYSSEQIIITGKTMAKLRKVFWWEATEVSWILGGPQRAVAGATGPWDYSGEGPFSGSSSVPHSFTVSSQLSVTTTPSTRQTRTEPNMGSLLIFEISEVA